MKGNGNGQFRIKEKKPERVNLSTVRISANRFIPRLSFLFFSFSFSFSKNENDPLMAPEHTASYKE